MSKRRLGALLAVTLVVAACSHRTGSESGASVVRLGDRRGAVPGPGLCRIYGAAAGLNQYLPQQCDGIEYAAPAGAEILFRPSDGTRHVVVCYLSNTQPPHLTGMDLYNIDTGSLVRVLLSYGEPTPTDNCRAAYQALFRR